MLKKRRQHGQPQDLCNGWSNRLKLRHKASRNNLTRSSSFTSILQNTRPRPLMKSWDSTRLTMYHIKLPGHHRAKIETVEDRCFMVLHIVSWCLVRIAQWYKNRITYNSMVFCFLVCIVQPLTSFSIQRNNHNSTCFYKRKYYAAVVGKRHSPAGNSPRFAFDFHQQVDHQTLTNNIVGRCGNNAKYHNNLGTLHCTQLLQFSLLIPHLSGEGC